METNRFWRFIRLCCLMGSVELVLLGIATITMSSCEESTEQPATDGDMGGPMWAGNPTIHMPFNAGTSWKCTQGAHGTYSHHFQSTEYDLDFDTPNPPELASEVATPVAGTVFVHEYNSGFGTHVNVDRGDGTFVVLGHMVAGSVAVSDGQWVDEGAFVGLAGCTGACSGAHVHVGLHEGDATVNATSSRSVQFNMFSVDLTGNPGIALPYSSESYTCGLSDGHWFESQLPDRESNTGGDEWEGDDDTTPVGDDDAVDDDDASSGMNESNYSFGCSDGADNDADGYFDCEDQDCWESPICQDNDPAPADDDDVASDDDDTTSPQGDDDSTPPEGDDDTTPVGDDDTTPTGDDDTTDSPLPAETVELCWYPVGLQGPQDGELWVEWPSGWQTIAMDGGSFTSLCGDVNAGSGDILTVNGVFSALNAPNVPWWICSNTGTALTVYGTMTVGGSPALVFPVSNGVGGCNARLSVP